MDPGGSLWFVPGLSKYTFQPSFPRSARGMWQVFFFPLKRAFPVENNALFAFGKSIFTRAQAIGRGHGS